MSRDAAQEWVEGDATACRGCGRDSCPGCSKRFLQVGEGRYRLEVDEQGLVFDVDRLRRESGVLFGEFVVRCALPGVPTVEGVLSAGDLNLSSVRARQERGKYLQERARVAEIDFVGLLEEFAQRVISSERAGAPAVLLRELPRPTADSTLEIDGFPLLRRHPVMLFGDGGAAKSYLALYLAARFQQAGERVGFFDWELAGEDHRDRLERLFGTAMPDIVYARCTRPLFHEADRLRRIVQDSHLTYAVLDSVAFACDGPPEAAEVAARYFQAVRQLGALGTLHVAHISRSEGADQKPFGSVFWHNGSRATWFVKLAEATAADRTTIGLYNRKANLGPLRAPLGFEIGFGVNCTEFRRVNVADTPDLAERIPFRFRVQHALRGGDLTVLELAEKLDANKDTIQKTVKRGEGKIFTLIPGPDGTNRVGLLERR
jgi:hypothetical protein